MKVNVLKNKAISLRKRGFSFREISEKLKISKSTASVWLKDIKLSEKAKQRIYLLGEKGRKNAMKSVLNRIAKENDEIMKKVKKSLNGECVAIMNLKFICALLYWCEGGKKERSKVAFINSDPNLIKYFLDVFRKAFKVDEKKFRALIHLHEYHDIDKQTDFWSKITRIPKEQFTKPYRKENGGKRKRENYQGCVSIRYNDRKIAKELIFLVKEFSK